MRQPSFWYRPPGLICQLLTPLGALYAAATRWHLNLGAHECAVIPVICIGNINVGGSGKTPTALALAERLLSVGHCPHFVTRGYRGSETGPLQVDIKRHKSDEVGDEPLLLAATAPTWVARDRAAGVSSAASSGANIAILDDGFQNAALRYNLSIIAVDARRGFGNGHVMPAGPLREKVRVGLSRADVLLLIGDSDDRRRFLECWRREIAIPIVFGVAKPLKLGLDWSGMRVVAFAGIAHPNKFFNMLRAEGAELVRQVALSDHARLSELFLQRLAFDAKSKNATLVTTEKDAVRLPKKWREQIVSLPIRLHVEDWHEIDLRLRSILTTEAKNGAIQDPRASSNKFARSL